jgi:hypothetical protein
MQGCEVDAGLFAIGHVKLDGRAAVDAARAHWRQRALASLQVRTVQQLPFRFAPPGAGQVTVQQPDPTAAMPSTEWLAVQGVRPDGRAVEARLLWVAQGSNLYHVAAYADTIADEVVEMLFTGVSLQ